MPFPFNRIPRGLLGLLDAKVRGQSPQVLRDELQLTLDGFGFYFAGAAELQAGQTLIPVTEGPITFQNNALIVPNDELWWVDTFSVGANSILGAGATLNLSPMVRVAAAAGIQLTDQLLAPPGPSFGQGSRPVWPAERSFWALPADALGAWIHAHDVYADILVGAARFSRFKI